MASAHVPLLQGTHCVCPTPSAPPETDFVRPSHDTAREGQRASAESDAHGEQKEPGKKPDAKKQEKKKRKQ
eukprot:2042644-Rhodomonas_salina.2